MGAATSRLFADEGAKVAIADVLDDDGVQLAAKLGEAARFYHHDVTSEEGWAELIRAVEADLGPVDILVNNAGIPLFRTLLDTTLAEYERVLKVNLAGEFLGMHLGLAEGYRQVSERLHEALHREAGEGVADRAPRSARAGERLPGRGAGDVCASGLWKAQGPRPFGEGLGKPHEL
jgi:NAD(P)-dependent dehydrogenase (short-subunit alcohol dehydrogenase family)